MGERQTVAIVPLNRSNYSTWRIQAKMALIRDNGWGIVNGTETVPTGQATDPKVEDFHRRKNRALSMIVLAMDPSLLYLIGDPEDPKIVWDLLEGQLQKKSWANKLSLRRKLFSMKLQDGESIHDHIKNMVEICFT